MCVLFLESCHISGSHRVLGLSCKGPIKMGIEIPPNGPRVMNDAAGIVIIHQLV